MTKRGPYIVQTHGHAREVGGRSITYKVWQNMLQRCRRQRDSYKGVTVCDRWRNFATFLEDMGPRPSEEHSIDRIDSGGNYEPGNCRWATWAEQARNRKSVVMLTHPDTGITMCMTDWADQLGVRKSTLHWRLKKWPLRDALSRRGRRYRKGRLES